MSDNLAQAREAHDDLLARLATIKDMDRAKTALLHDTVTYLARGSLGDRSNQTAALGESCDLLAGDPAVGRWLQAVQALPAAERDEAALSLLGTLHTLYQDEPFASQPPYEKLKRRYETISHLGAAASIFQYDNAVFDWPSQDDVVAYSTALSVAAHELLVMPEVGQWLDAAEADAAALPEGDRRNLFLMRRQWIHETALDADLVAAQSRLYSEGESLHTKNRKGGDWSTMRDWYKHSFDVMRAIGAAKQEKLGTPTIYDALLDSFSPGITDAALEKEFSKLETILPVLVRAAQAKQASEPAPLPLTGTFPRAQQEELFRRVGEAMQFDLNHGRYDVIDGHPSTTGTAMDTRFTTDCHEDNFLNGLYSFIHEGGHGKYCQGLPKEWLNQPAGGDLGMGVHETQSRIMELYACRTPEFLGWLEAQAREVFGRPDDPALAAENLGRLLNRVKPSFIRIEADGMTYPAHILLRRKLEKALLEETISIDELPQAWSDGMQKLLGITPPDPSKGCMQDVHWPVGLVGYFPAYTLGDAGAAQLFAAACRARPELTAELGKGNFAPLNEWLDENVRGKGSLLPTDEMFIAATGEPLNFDYYLERQSRFYLGKPLQAVMAPPSGPSAPSAPQP